MHLRNSMKAFRDKDRAIRGARRGTGGFTLVELLVVVSIIALLLGLLLPALGKAKQAAIDVRCQSDMRQFGLAILTYSNEYEAYLPTFGGKEDAPQTMHSHLGLDVIDSYGGIPEELGGNSSNTSLEDYNWFYKITQGGYFNTDGALACPALKNRYYKKYTEEHGDELEDFPIPSDYVAPFTHVGNDPFESFRVSTAAMPSMVVLLGEISLNWMYPKQSANDFGYYYWTSSVDSDGNPFRHHAGNKANHFILADGHVELVAFSGRGNGGPSTGELGDCEVEEKLFGEVYDAGSWGRYVLRWEGLENDDE